MLRLHCADLFRGKDFPTRGKKARVLFAKMVPDKLDQENPVSVQLLNPGPHIRAASKFVAGFPELLDSAADFLVFVRNDVDEGSVSADRLLDPRDHGRSEERRVGKECRSRWS